MILLVESDLTLWKDRETWGVGLTDKSTVFYTVYHAGSIPARPAT